MNAPNLIKAFQKMATKLDLNEVKLTEKLDLEMQRFKKMQAMFLGKEKTKEIQPVDLRGYTVFVLKEGSILEQRSVLDCVSSQLVVNNKQVAFYK